MSTFYSPQTRFWELLCGSLLGWMTVYKKDSLVKSMTKADAWLGALIFKQAPEADGKRLSNVLSIVGLFLLVYGFYYIDKDFHFPGKWALVPVLGCVSLISAGPNAWINRRVLSNRLAVWFGLLSFPLYLWHWPLLSFARIVNSGVPSTGFLTTTVVLSIVLAWLTYKFVERPIRLGKSSKLKVPVLVVLMLITGYVGYSTYIRDGLGFRIKNHAKFASISKAAGEWQFPGSLKPYSFNDRYFLFQESGLSSITLFVGDSNIEQYYVRIDELIKTERERTNSIIFARDGGCLPIPLSPYDDKHKHCFGLMEAALQLAKQDPHIRNVVIGGQWNGYFTSGGKLVGNFAYGSDLYKLSLTRLSSYIKDLTKSGKKVFFVLNIPTDQKLDPKYMAQRSLVNFPDVFKIREGGVDRKTLNDKFGAIQSDLRRVAEASGAIVIQPLDYLCDDLYCPSVYANGEPMYKDKSHLRPTYVRYKVKFIDSTVTSR